MFQSMATFYLRGLNIRNFKFSSKLVGLWPKRGNAVHIRKPFYLQMCHDPLQPIGTVDTCDAFVTINSLAPKYQLIQ